MKACITEIPVGTHFLYKQMSWVVVSRDEYPFIEVKCETEPNDYEGINVLFGNFERVEVPDNTPLWKAKLVQAGKNHYCMTEELK